MTRRVYSLHGAPVWLLSDVSELLPNTDASLIRRLLKSGAAIGTVPAASLRPAPPTGSGRWTIVTVEGMLRLVRRRWRSAEDRRGSDALARAGCERARCAQEGSDEQRQDGEG